MNAVPASLSDDLSGGRRTAAERSFWHKALIGGLIGGVVGALFYAGVVAVALAGHAIDGPAVWIGAVVGVFGGVFLGSWGGVMAGLKNLEVTEHDLVMERTGRPTDRAAAQSMTAGGSRSRLPSPRATDW